MRAVNDRILAVEQTRVEWPPERDAAPIGAGNLMTTRPQKAPEIRSQVARHRGDEDPQPSSPRSVVAIRIAFAMIVNVRFLAGSLVKHAPSTT